MLVLKIALLVIGCAAGFAVIWAKTNAMNDPDWPRIEDKEESPEPVFKRDRKPEEDEKPSLFI
jgi:hypothetical protein